MTEREVQEKLNAYRIACRDYQVVLRRAQELGLQSTAIGSMTPKEVRVLSSPPLSAGYEDKVIDKADLEKILREELAVLLSVKRSVIRMIEKIPDRQQRMILEMRYVQLMSWNRIIRVINYSDRQVFRIHRKAVKYFCKRCQ